MKKLLTFLGIIFGLFLIIAFAAPFFISGKAYQTIIEKNASKALAREVRLREAPSFTLLPTPSFKAKGLTIANEEGFEAPYFARVEQARIKVKLWPLFSKKAVIDAFILEQPEISLERLADGRVNWILGAPDGGSAEGRQPSNGNDLSLGDARLIDGRVSFNDAQAQQNFLADNVNLTIGLKSLANPLTIDGTMNFQGTPSTLFAELTTPASLMANAPSQLELKLKIADNLIDSNINLAGGDLAYDGRLALDAPTLRSLLATFGAPIKVEKGFERLKLSGSVKGSANEMHFHQADLTFDDIKGRGDLDFYWGGPRPTVNGNLALSVLDLRPYLPAPSAAAKASREDKSAPFPAWSEEPLSFDFLKTVDGRFDVTTDGILLHDITFGKSALTANLKNGRMQADLTALTLYGGSGTGALIVDASRPAPAINGQFRLNQLDARDFTRSLMGLNRVAGLGDFTVNFSATGTSQATIMAALDGAGNFQLTDGVLEGIDIGLMAKSAFEIVKDLRAGQLNQDAFSTALSGALGANAKTDFSQLVADFKAQDGIIRTQNIRLSNPYFTLEGRGLINLPDQTLTLQIAPLLTNLQGDNGQGLPIPLQITGGFNSVSFSVDTQTLLRSLADNRLRSLLQQNGIDIPDGTSLGDIVRSEAEDRLKEAIGLPNNKNTPEPNNSESAPPAEPPVQPANGEENSNQTSLEDLARERAEEELANILGFPKNKAPTEEAPSDNQDDTQTEDDTTP